MPGKFEGEPAYAEYFYNLAMESGADETFLDSASTQIDVWRLEADDFDKFPDLINDEYVLLWEDEQGFIYTDTATSEGDLIDSLETMGVDDEQIDSMSFL